jgi:hypothetical protein
MLSSRAAGVLKALSIGYRYEHIRLPGKRSGLLLQRLPISLSSCGLKTWVDCNGAQPLGPLTRDNLGQLLAGSGARVPQARHPPTRQGCLSGRAADMLPR